MDFRRGHRVTHVFRKRSQGHGRISAVTNCDPGRGRMHCAYGSDHPLLYRDDISDFKNRFLRFLGFLLHHTLSFCVFASSYFVIL